MLLNILEPSLRIASPKDDDSISERIMWNLDARAMRVVFGVFPFCLQSL